MRRTTSIPLSLLYMSHPAATHHYFEQNWPQIQSEIKTRGLKKTLKRWQIRKDTWARLEKYPKLGTAGPASDKTGGKKITADAGVPVAKSNHPLPSFPVFQDTWQPATQVAWLDAYARVATNGG